MNGQQDKVRYGFSECALAFFKTEATDAAPEWEPPVKAPGGVSLAMSPENNEVKFFADNIAYYVTSKTTSAKGDLEMALLTDELQAKMLGWKIDKNGALVEVADGKATSFALLFQIEGDAQGRRNIYYNCSAGAPNVEHTTNNDGVEVKTMKFPVTATPIKLGEKYAIKASLSRSKNPEVYDAWYTEVYVPDFTEAGGAEGGGEAPDGE